MICVFIFQQVWCIILWSYHWVIISVYYCCWTSLSVVVVCCQHAAVMQISWWSDTAVKRRPGVDPDDRGQSQTSCCCYHGTVSRWWPWGTCMLSLFFTSKVVKCFLSFAGCMLFCRVLTLSIILRFYFMMSCHNLLYFIAMTFLLGPFRCYTDLLWWVGTLFVYGKIL